MTYELKDFLAMPHNFAKRYIICVQNYAEEQGYDLINLPFHYVIQEIEKYGIKFTLKGKVYHTAFKTRAI